MPAFFMPGFYPAGKKIAAGRKWQRRALILNSFLPYEFVAFYVNSYQRHKPYLKAGIMNNSTTIQELLLNVNSSFCKREWCEKDGKQQTLPPAERLKTLCWDGLLPEILPEICLKENNKPLILWELMGMSNTLHLKLGGYNEQLNPELAVHPYFVLDYMCNN